ncbi:MAG: transporter substrate-binding domain-containing protein [Pseudomonadota bacterium]|uniref:transporter substrate-binding domain-containing protein n=1 Tax=Burkholderia sp. PAMC 28687 TaxID=1795874 RepID=UPI0007805903|nr:transporter substrate-binding domain-containing protein [Burkholderia sp. PAMC 28687]AMM13235.1 ABC transporter substrate-binding protein [Burkholderia sp. PAMC 28687]MDP9153592.1 transporter substrate-binding domain-containing protein [Pseudomonadota bacterium]
MTGKTNLLARLAASVAVGVIALGAANAQAKDWKTVTIATEGAYEPWNLTLPGGKLGGFEPELIQNVCDRIKIQCKLVTQDWDGMIAGLQAGKFDVLMDAISVTPEREKIIAFSRPYASTPAAFVASGDAPAALAKQPGAGQIVKLTGDAAHDKTTVDALRVALKGKTIGIQSGTVYTKFIDTNFKDVATIREYKTAPEHDLDLVAGRIDVAFDDSTYWASAFAKPENKGLAFTGPKISGPVWGPGEALAFRQSDKDLKAKFDEGIAAALADGTVKRLSMKWMKVDATP